MASSEEKLRKLLVKIAKEQNYREDRIIIHPINSGGANFTTNLYKGIISASFKPDIKLFAKIANLSEEVRGTNEALAKVYLVETIFYTELSVTFEKLYEKNKVPTENRLVKPEYYGHELSDFKEILVLEDLEAKGYKNFDRMKTFDWEYASIAVQHLAELHALGIAYQKENAAEFEEVVTKFEINFESNSEMTMMFLTKAIADVCAVVSLEYKKKLEKYFSSQDVIKQAMSRFMTDKTMLIHGDYRPSNLMHKRRVSITTVQNNIL